MTQQGLGQRGLITLDLRSLLDALFNPTDRLAWLSVLRAPWCGLTLGELLALVGDDARPVERLCRVATERAHMLGLDGVPGRHLE